MSSAWARRPDRRLYVVVGIVLLSAGLRLFRLLEQSLWYDEAFDALLAQTGLGGILAGVKSDTMPPLHYVLLYGWTRLGAGEFVVKLFPVFMGVLATAIVYPLGRRLLDPNAGLGGALLTALSPFQVYYGREVRMYSQLLVFGLLSVLFVARCMDDREVQGARRPFQPWADWIGLVAFTTLTVYTHTLGFLTPLSVGAAALALKRRDRRFMGRLLLAGAAVVALAAPWLLFVLPGQASRVVTVFWVDRPSVLAPLITTYMFLAGYAIPPPWMPVALFVTLASVAIALYRAFRMPGGPLTLLLAWLLGPVCGVWLFSLFAPLYLDRLFIASAPALYLLVSWGMARVPRGLGHLFGALLVGVIVLSLGQYYFNPAYHKPPMRAAAAYVAGAALPGDVVLHTSDGSLLPFAYYAPHLEQLPVAGDPEHQPGTVRAQSLQLLGYAPVESEKVLATHDRVWLVVALDHSVEFQRDALRGIADTRGVSLEANVGGIEVYLIKSGRAP